MADQAARNEFDAAVHAVRSQPDDFDSWDVVESLTEILNCPDEVASLYKQVLAMKLSRDVASALGERAAGFFEEWFGDDPHAVRDVLLRVLEIDPRADWAFQRLTLESAIAMAAPDESQSLREEAAARLSALDEAARLAESLGETDRALDLWQSRIDASAPAGAHSG